MSGDFIAPIQIVNLFVVDSDFHIEDSPSDNMELKVDVSYQDVHLWKNGNDARASLKMCVIGSLLDRDEGAQEKMHRRRCTLALQYPSRFQRKCQ